MGIGVAIAGLFKGLVTAAGGLTLAGHFVAFGIEAVISLAASALTKPKGYSSAGTAQRQGRTENIRSNTFPHHAVYGECRKGGLIFYLNGTGLDNEFLHIGLALAAHECEFITDIHFNGEYTELDVTGNPTGDLKDYARIQWMLGASNQLALADMVTENTNWTNAHTASGHSYLYARLKYSNDKFPNFIPAMTARIKGQNQIYDPRTNSAGWTDNPALCLADVMERYLRIPRSRIDTAHLIEAANVCDEVVFRKSGQAERRYCCGGFFELQGEPSDWLTPFISAMAGNVTEFGGVYYISAGHFKPAVTTITDDNIVSGIRYRTAGSDFQRSNSAKGVFVGRESFDQPTDFPAIKDATAIAEDGGVVNWLELDLEFVANHTQAQRIASINLRQSREDETVEMSIDLLKGLDIKPWDTVELNVEAMALTGTWQVIEHKIIPNEGEGMSVEVALKRHTASVYDWNPATQELPHGPQQTNVPGHAAVPISHVSTSLYMHPTHAEHYPVRVNLFWYNFINTLGTIEVEMSTAYEYRVQGSGGAWQSATILYAQDIGAYHTTEMQHDIFVDLKNDSLTDPGGYEFRNIEMTSCRMRVKYSESSYSAWINAFVHVVVSGEEAAKT